VRAPGWLALITEAEMTKSKKSIAKTNSASSRSRHRENGGSTEQKPTKSDVILTLLRRKQGASLEEMQKASGWQPHSVRGYLSGTVKKRLGFTLKSSKSPDGERRYVIVAG
jgi:hypothetical protein